MRKKNNNLWLFILGGIVIALAVYFIYTGYNKSVTFRTSDLSYEPNSAIAYADVKGQDLTVYGRGVYIDGSTSDKTCSQSYTKMFNVPGFIIYEDVYLSGPNKGQIYNRTVSNTAIYSESSPNMIYVCSDFEIGGYVGVSYDKTLPALIAVSTSPKSIDPLKEVLA